MIIYDLMLFTNQSPSITLNTSLIIIKHSNIVKITCKTSTFHENVYCRTCLHSAEWHRKYTHSPKIVHFTIKIMMKLKYLLSIKHQNISFSHRRCILLYEILIRKNKYILKRSGLQFAAIRSEIQSELFVFIRNQSVAY